MIEKIHDFGVCTTTYTPNDYMGHTFTENLNEQYNKINEVVDVVNKNITEQGETNKDIYNTKEDKNNITVKRKLSENGNFTGTWCGYEPTEIDPMYQNMLNKNIADVNVKKANVPLLYNFFKNIYLGDGKQIVIKGDSTVYGADKTCGREPDPISADDGTKHYSTRANITLTESLQNNLNKIFGANKFNVKNHGFEGDTTLDALTRFNVSNASICGFMFGINDADNSNKPTNSNIFDYIENYRKLIERELLNGTPCFVITPFKGVTLTGTSIRDRARKIQIWGESLKRLCEEYKIPLVDSTDFFNGTTYTIYSDNTHLNTIGYDYMGARLTSLFVGKGLTEKCIVKDKFLGVNTYSDNFKENNVLGWYYNANIPNLNSDSADGGTYINMKYVNSSITYAFYTNEENIIITPNFQCNYDTFKLKMTLDGGVLPNAILNTDCINKDYTQPLKSSVEYLATDLNRSRVFSPNMIKFQNEKHLLVTGKGWHIVTIELLENQGEAVFSWFGLKFEGVDNFVNRTYEVHTPILENGVTLNNRPVKIYKKNGYVFMEGSLTLPTDIKGKTMFTLPPNFRPQSTRTYLTTQSYSTTSIGVVQVGLNGTVILNNSTSSETVLQLDSVNFIVM